MGRQSLQAQLDGLKADGLPINIADLDAYYAIPAGEVDSTEEWMAAFTAVDQPKFQQGVQDFPIVGEAELPPVGEDWSGLDDASEFIAAGQAEFELIQAAAEKRGTIRYPIQFNGINANLTPFLQHSRLVSRLLALSAHVHARKGDCPRAMQDIHTSIMLSDALNREVTMISNLVSVAIRANAFEVLEQILPACELSDGEILKLQEANRRANQKSSLLHALHGERAFVMTAIDMFPLVPLRVANKRVALAYYEQILANVDGPWSDVLEKQKKISADFTKRYSGMIGKMQAVGVNLSSAANVNFLVANARVVAQQRCVNVAIALKRMQLAGEELPEMVTDIPDRYLTRSKEVGALLIDPFDGEPLRMLTQDKRILIYSVGENLVDDSGHCIRGGKTPSLDIGFWLPID